MPDVFEQFHRHVESIFGDEPVCVHTQDIRDCPMKQHPDYVTFRKNAVTSGIKSSSGTRSHTWESMVALGRLGDMDNDNRWGMVVLDCISPVLRAKSWKISRDFYTDCEEVQSDMMEVAISTWTETAHGFPPKAVRGTMVKSAFAAAYDRARVNKRESSKFDMEPLHLPAAPSKLSARSEVSFINVSDVQSPEVAAVIRGEQYGCWLYEPHGIDHAKAFHSDVRTDRSPAKPFSAQAEEGAARGTELDGNCCYRISDLLPASIGVKEAAAAMGITESAARRKIRDGEFPCPVTTMGRSYSISVRAFMRGLNIHDSLVHPDDVENGAAHAAMLLGGVDLSEVPQGLDCPER